MSPAQHMRSQKGQSLVELLVAISIGIIFIIGAVGALSVTLRLESQSTHGQPATELTAELAEEIRTVVNDDWHSISSLVRNDANAKYRVEPSGNFYTIPTDQNYATINPNGTAYRRYFLVEDAYRDSQNQLVDTPGTIDPSTLKITAITEWDQLGQTADSRLVFYVTRNRNRVWQQTDWSGGATGDGPVTGSTDLINIPTIDYTSKDNINATSTAGQLTINDTSLNLVSGPGNGIDPSYPYAWSDTVGWLDFVIYGNVTLQPGSAVTGYGSSSVGYIALNCATSPSLPPPGTADICSTNAQFGVSEDNAGILSGFGWSDTLGWISFNCVTASNCASQVGVDYKVSVDANTGFLHGWAWSDVGGWISFNCDHSDAGDPLGINTCPAGRGGNGTAADYAVRTGVSSVSTGELISKIYDTTRGTGVSVNTIAWNGVSNGGSVEFQLATGNTTGEVSTSSFIGPNGSSNTWYTPLAPNVPIKINKANHPDAEYIRYKVRLKSNAARNQSPQVKDVIINYSL